MIDRTCLTVEVLDSRCNPAVLDIVGTALTFAETPGESNTLTLAVSGGVYSFKDTASLVTLGAGAVAAGWRGSGTHTVSGPESSVDSIEIDVGGGTNVVNVKSLHDPLTVSGGIGTTTVNVNSVAPSYIGNLSTITAPIEVDAGADTTLNVSDYTGSVTSDPTVIDATGIYLPTRQPVTYTGTFTQIHVWARHGTPLSQYVVTDPPTANLLLG